MKIANLKIGTRLAAAFGFLCVALVFMVGQGTVMLGRINDGTDGIVNKRLPRIELSNRLQNQVNQIAIAMRNIMLSDQDSDRARQRENIVAARGEIDVILGQLDKSLSSEHGRAILARQQELNARYVKNQGELLKLIDAGNEQGARAYLITELRPLLVSYQAAIVEQIKMQRELSASDAAAAAQLYAETRTLMIVLGAVVLALAAALAWWITKSITRPLQHALDVANAVAGGDLTARVEATTTCEMGQLLHALKRMNDNLVSTVSTVRSGTDAIGTASSQVSAGNQDLSSRTEQQASSLEETASSMEELTGTVKQNADNARQANTLAETASGVATRGGKVIEEVVDTMAQIHAASGKITDIISVIDGIAFQTNILALNAAVEAARAGEQGRGFAVVAGEVRNLAQRSAAAAKEIKTLIADSSGKVETGSRLVQEAGSTMTDIVQSVRRVADILGEISSASAEQSAGIEQVNQAITQMDDRDPAERRAGRGSGGGFAGDAGPGRPAGGCGGRVQAGCFGGACRACRCGAGGQAGCGGQRAAVSLPAAKPVVAAAKPVASARSAAKARPATTGKSSKPPPHRSCEGVIVPPALSPQVSGADVAQATWAPAFAGATVFTSSVSVSWFPVLRFHHDCTCDRLFDAPAVPGVSDNVFTRISMTGFVISPPAVPALAVADSDQSFPLRRVFCVGRNYAAHAREMGSDPNREPPFFFTKPADAVVPADRPLPYPPATQDLHHEIELVVALGAGGADIDPARPSTWCGAMASAST
jgi:methyl-accepting chemotaxis protein